MWILLTLFQPESMGIRVSVLRGCSSLPTYFVVAPIVIEVKDTGPMSSPELFLNSKVITWAGLPYELKKQLALRPDWVVYVHGDDDVPYLDVLSVMDIAREERARVVLLTPKTDGLVPRSQNTLQH